MLKKLWQRLSLATLLAVAMATVWGMLVAWAVVTYELRANRHRAYEDLAVDTHGNAWIKVSRIEDGFMRAEDRPYRTLAGEPIAEPEHGAWISGTHLMLPSALWYVEQFSGDWNQRVSHLIRNEREVWYSVHNGLLGEAGKCYLVGYDLRSKLPLGYCSLAGFRKDLPAPEDWFQIDGKQMRYGGGGYAVGSSWKSPSICIACSQGWYRFDVLPHRFTALDDQHAYISTNTLTLTEPLEVLDPGEDPAPEQANEAAALDPAGLEVFVARRADRIVVRDPQRDEPLEFAIPPEQQQQSLTLFLPAENQALLQLGRVNNQEPESSLVWINPAGEVEKTSQIHWKTHPQTPPKAMFALLTAAVPIPIVQGAILNVGARQENNSPYENWREASYFQRLGLLLSDAWPSMLGLYLVVAGLIWLAMQWHKRYARPHPLTWAMFIFLLGVPGFFAYWLYHRRPSIESCEACHETTPHDRDACARCQQPFAEPSLTGTEVFA